MNPLLGLITGAAGKVLDKIFPDETERAAAQLELMKLAQAGEFKELESSLERLRIEQGDRVDARLMQRETKGKVAPVLAVATFVGFFAVLLLMVFVEIPAAAQGPVNIMLGSLQILLASVAAFYFGSSQGSKSKQATIDHMIQAQGNAERAGRIGWAETPLPDLDDVEVREAL